jgi:hypothetical protein
MSRKLDTAFHRVPCRHSSIKKRRAVYHPARPILGAAWKGGFG